MADRQRGLRGGDQSEFVVAAVLMLSQLVSDDRLHSIIEPRLFPGRLRLPVVVISKQLGVHQTRVERHLAGMRDAAASPVARVEAVVFAAPLVVACAHLVFVETQVEHRLTGHDVEGFGIATREIHSVFGGVWGRGVGHGERVERWRKGCKWLGGVYGWLLK